MFKILITTSSQKKRERFDIGKLDFKYHSNVSFIQIVSKHIINSFKNSYKCGMIVLQDSRVQKESWNILFRTTSMLRAIQNS